MSDFDPSSPRQRRSGPSTSQPNGRDSRPDILEAFQAFKAAAADDSAAADQRDHFFGLAKGVFHKAIHEHCPGLDPWVADGVVSDALLKILRPGVLEGVTAKSRGELAAYLSMVAVRSLQTDANSRKLQMNRQAESLLVLGDDLVRWARDKRKDECVELLNQALEEMTRRGEDAEAYIIRLRYVYNLSIREIGLLLAGQPNEVQIQSRIDAARDALRRRLDRLVR